MNDRELLDMAAKAAGYDVVCGHGWQSEHMFRRYARPDGLWTYERFDPIDDDGDAFRLSVVLKLRIDHTYLNEMKVMVGNGECWAIEKYNGEPLPATRLAIVRTAAEIGRNMK